jgi:hypothetical protein
VHKGIGRAQQIRGHKRRAKVLNMRKRRPFRKNTSEAGNIYWNHLINDEAKKLNNKKIESESKISTSQVESVKPQVHRRKSGSA